MNKINWNNLSLNPNAIRLLERNMDKINWNNFSLNPNAIRLLERTNNNFSLNIILIIIFVMIIIQEINNYTTFKNLVSYLLTLHNLYDIIVSIIINNKNILFDLNGLKMIIELLLSII
jgi:hypothetical protein